MKSYRAYLKKYYENDTLRYYHNSDHILSMLKELEEYTVSEEERDILEKAIVFHDVVYDPRRKDNEELSCQKFIDCFPDDKNKETICDLIMATKYHIKNGDKLNGIIIDLDLSILKSDIGKLIEYENKIFKEYQFVNISTYIKERIAFLKNIREKIEGKDHIEELIKYISTKNYSIGIYAGSFNPFHVGHKNILEKAEKIFDKVIIAKGINPEKEKSSFKLPESLLNETVEYSGLVTELFKPEENIRKTFIRGLRNVHDVGYEENMRKIINDINPDIEFVYFFCDSEFQHISSSQIKSLMPFDKSFCERYLVK